MKPDEPLPEASTGKRSGRRRADCSACCARQVADARCHRGHLLFCRRSTWPHPNYLGDATDIVVDGVYSGVFEHDRLGRLLAVVA